MKYTSEITEILSLALEGNTATAEDKLSLFISMLEYEGDKKAAKKLRKAFPDRTHSKDIPAKPKLFLEDSAISAAEDFMKAFRMKDILESESIPAQLLLTISGPEGSGRTTLASFISSSLSMPLVSGNGESEPSSGKILHITGKLSEERLRELASRDYLTIYETDAPELPKDAMGIAHIALSLPSDAKKEEFIRAEAGNITKKNMKVLLELFRTSGFSDILRAILAAKRKATTTGSELSWAAIAYEAMLALPGAESHEDEKTALKKRAKMLREMNPDVFSIQIIADIFSRPKASIYYIVTT